MLTQRSRVNVNVMLKGSRAALQDDASIDSRGEMEMFVGRLRQLCVHMRLKNICPLFTTTMYTDTFCHLPGAARDVVKHISSFPFAGAAMLSPQLRKQGLFWELNPGPLAPEARIIPLDQTASCVLHDIIIFPRRLTYAGHTQFNISTACSLIS